MRRTRARARWPQLAARAGAASIEFGALSDWPHTVTRTSNFPKTHCLLIRSETLLDFTGIPQIKRWCCVLTRNLKFKRWIIRNRSCPCGRDKRSAAPMITSATVPLHCLMPWTLRAARLSANCIAATVRWSSASSSTRSTLQCQKGFEVHLILDNYGPHKNHSSAISTHQKMKIAWSCDSLCAVTGLARSRCFSGARSPYGVNRRTAQARSARGNWCGYEPFPQS